MRISGVLLLGLAVGVAGCQGPRNNLPPAEMIMHPGPGVDGPGPGVMMFQPPVTAPQIASQVKFDNPESMVVQWDVTMPGAFDSPPLVTPGRYNFGVGAIYRLKLTNIPGRAGVELYPTVEIGPVVPRTEAFLAHNAIPVNFTEEDFDQVLGGNFVTKVIYLPDPEFQELALAGVETLVSTRLDPGVDPIVEADTRGAILAIVRLGNKDLQIPGEAGGAGMVGGDPSLMASIGPDGCPLAPGQGGLPCNYVAGVNVPQYGMPYCGTPIGLPGPAHVPLGVPAGLNQHVMRNHTRVRIPGPTERVVIDVKQNPGMTYPVPANHAWITESTQAPNVTNMQPRGNANQYNPYGVNVDPYASGASTSDCPIQ